MATLTCTHDHVVPTLPGRYYHDSEIYALEQEHVFGASWVCVGLACAIPDPGSYFLAEVAGENIVVLRDRAGVVRAFFNVCRHRAARLCTLQEGKLGASIQCRYHAWTYALDGRLLGAPNMREDPDFDAADYGLVPVHLQLWEGLIFVNLAEKPGALVDQAEQLDHPVIKRYRLADLGVGGTLRYDQRCNWKIAIANYNECAHCALVHPELSAQVPTFRAGYTTGGLDNGAEFLDGIESLTMTGKTTRPPLPGLLPEDHHKYYGMVVLPNVFLDFQPDYVVVTILQPTGPERMHLVSYLLFDRHTMARPDFDPSDAIEFNDIVSRQDGEVCELSQLGVHSRVVKHGGLYGPTERHIREFDDYTLRMIGHHGRA